MARRREEEVVPDPVTNLKGFPIHYDESTNENHMRRVSVRDMMALAKKPDVDGRLLLHEELAQAKPNEDIIEVLLEVEPDRIKKKNPKSGCLPIHIACININSIPSDILVLLLDAWPDSIKTQCNYGFLPLHKAILANVIGNNPPNMDNITMVLEAYPEGVYMTNLRGQNPLHCALESKKVCVQNVACACMWCIMNMCACMRLLGGCSTNPSPPPALRSTLTSWICSSKRAAKRMYATAWTASDTHRCTRPWGVRKGPRSA